jgi:purine catabolism regulator
VPDQPATDSLRAAPAAAPITIALALRLPSMRRGAPKVLAGRSNLGRHIRWVHVGEVRNIAELLRGGELLLTTGMGIAPAAAAQRAFVRRLAERGVAGIVLELGQVFERAPDALVAEAEAHGMPLIALEREVRFVEITEAMHGAIVDRQLAILRRGDELHRRFTELMLEGAAIPEILAALSSAIAAPIILDRAGEGVLYHVTYRAAGGDVLAAWELLREQLDRGDPEPRDAVVLPIITAGQTEWGHLAALALDSPLDDFDRVALERAVPLISLALLRSQEEELLGARERGNFLAEVADGTMDPRDAAHRAQAVGFVAGRRRLLSMAVVAGNERVVRDPALSQVWRAVRQDLEQRGLPVLIGARAHDRDTLLVMAMPPHLARADAMDTVAAAIDRAAERQLGRSPALVIAAGAEVPGWAELAAALREAAETAVASRHAPPRSWHDATEPSVDRLIWRLRDAPGLRTFAERRLEPLLEHDRRRSTLLVDTLDALFRTGGQKTDAARVLHITRQSLYARLERIEELLGEPLDTPDTRFGLELAVRVSRHLDGG